MRLYQGENEEEEEEEEEEKEGGGGGEEEEGGGGEGEEEEEEVVEETEEYRGETRFVSLFIHKPEPDSLSFVCNTHLFSTELYSKTHRLGPRSQEMR